MCTLLHNQQVTPSQLDHVLLAITVPSAQQAPCLQMAWQVTYVRRACTVLRVVLLVLAVTREHSATGLILTDSYHVNSLMYMEDTCIWYIKLHLYIYVYIYVLLSTCVIGTWKQDVRTLITSFDVQFVIINYSFVKCKSLSLWKIGH